MLEIRDLVLQDMADLGHIEMEDIRVALNISRTTLDRLFLKNMCSRSTIRKVAIVTKRPMREYEACEFKLV